MKINSKITYQRILILGFLVLTVSISAIAGTPESRSQNNSSKLSSGVAEMLAQLKDKDPEKRQQAALNLYFKEAGFREIEVKKTDRPAIVAALSVALKDKAETVRSSAATALEKYGDESATQALISCLNDSDLNVRQRAIQALRKIRDKRAGDALLKTLVADKNNTVRWFAAYFFRETKDKSKVPALLKIANNYKYSASIREGAIHALGGIGDPRAKAVIIKALKDKDTELRARAVVALGELGSQKTIQITIPMLKDKERKVRLYTVLALSDYKNPVVIPHLIKALKDKDSEVRETAAGRLKQYYSKHNSVKKALARYKKKSSGS